MAVVAHSIEIQKEADGRVLFIAITGVLTKCDYEVFVPVIDGSIADHGSVRVLFDLVGFRGWTLGALWEDTKFGFTHLHGIERIAFIGDRKWEKGLAAFCRPFTDAEVRYFDLRFCDKAKAWLRAP